MACKEITIDELKICYVADAEILRPMKETEIGGYLNLFGYRLHRVVNDRFKYFFDITYHGKMVAQLRFGFYTDQDETNTHVYFKVLNEILYRTEALASILLLPERLGMVFNNFTALDLALDTPCNVPSMIKRLMRRKDVTTIINGKAIKDRKQTLCGVSFEYSTTLDRLNNPTITFKQKKAIANKSEGITVQTYNKKAEVENRHPEKQYILDSKDNPRHLYRLEVRLHYQELKDYFLSKKIPATVVILNDQELLWEMFCYHLASVIRFTHGRHRIPWDFLLESIGRV